MRWINHTPTSTKYKHFVHFVFVPSKSSCFANHLSHEFHCFKSKSSWKINDLISQSTVREQSYTNSFLTSVSENMGQMSRLFKKDAEKTEKLSLLRFFGDVGFYLLFFCRPHLLNHWGLRKQSCKLSEKVIRKSCVALCLLRNLSFLHFCETFTHLQCD